MVGQDCRVRLALCTPLIIHHVHLMQVSLTLALHISCVRSMTPVCIVLQGLWPTIFDRGGSQPGSNIARCRPSGILYLQLDVYSARCKLSLTKMFFGAATDTQCAAFLTTPRFADPDSVSRGQQCRLLQLGPSQCVWPSSRPAAVSSQRRRSTDLVGEEVKTQNPLLSELHWLRVLERIQFQLCVLAYRCLHDTAPSYIAEMLHRTIDVDGRCCLCSAATSTRRSSLGDRAFPVAASRA